MNGQETTTQEQHPYTVLPITLFSINYNKTHKSRLKYEISVNIHVIYVKKIAIF